MGKALRLFFIGTLAAGIGLGVWRIIPAARAVDCQSDPACLELAKQISDLNRDLQNSVKATAPLEGEVSRLQGRIKDIQNKVSAATQKSRELADGITRRESSLADQYIVFSRRVRAQYMTARAYSPLEAFFGSESLGEAARSFHYQQAVQQRNRALIQTLGKEILQLEKDKRQVELDKTRLAGLQKELDGQVAFFQKEISGAKRYQQELAGKIAALSARQQEILTEKQGSFQLSVGDVPLADDANASPTFNPGFSPAFAVFSFGAPHYNGMSQYGAFGRAKEGQNAEAILRAYYGEVELKKDYNQSEEICVGSARSTCQRMSLEEYTKRIHEVPNSWGDNGGQEALKAQAVAARSYALSAMARNGFICATEACQVYKPTPKGGNWESAVNATAGWVLMKNGKPLMAKYASTAGGYIEKYTDAYSGHATSSFWDTKNGRDGWTSQAFEKISGSPWFYKAWYKTRGGDSCGRSHPWLNQEEMADILNAWQVLKSGSDSRISPLGGCWGGNPYSLSELRQKAETAGGAFTAISGVSVEYSTQGVTSAVRFQTDRGEVSVPGSEFKNVFNLRAPARISVKSGLFNIERK